MKMRNEKIIPRYRSAIKISKKSCPVPPTSVGRAYPEPLPIASTARAAGTSIKSGVSTAAAAGIGSAAAATASMAPASSDIPATATTAAVSAMPTPSSSNAISTLPPPPPPTHLPMTFDGVYTLPDGTITIPPVSRGILYKIVFGNFKYKLLTTAIILGGAYAFFKYLQSQDEDDEMYEKEEEEHKHDEYENEITYLEMDERSLCRRLVAKLWIPSIRSNYSLFSSLQTTKEIQDASALSKVWHYSELDQEHLSKFITASHEHEHAAMPTELKYLSKATKILGHFDKKSIMATWKNIGFTELQAGEYLFRITDPDIYVYVVLSGEIQLVINDPEVQAKEKIKKPYLTLKKIRSGQQIYSTLSFLDVITGHPGQFKSVEAMATQYSTVLQIPIEDFRNNWLENPGQLNMAVRRLIRRIYQVVFVAMHKVLGLSSEVTKQTGRKELDPDYVADQSTTVSPELKEKAIKAAREYLEMEASEFDEYFTQCQVVILPKGSKPVRAGTRSNRLVFVYEGEIEVTSFLDISHEELANMANTEKLGLENQMEELLYYVPAGEAIGALSYLTDGVNIFNINIPLKATMFVMPESVMIKLLKDYPLMVLKLAHSVVLRESAFMRQMDFGLEWCFFEGGEAVFKPGDLADQTYLVLSGRLRSLVQDENGKTKMLHEYGRNDWIGLVDTLTQTRRTKSVIAIRDSELCRVPDGVLHLIKIKFPVVTMRLLDFVGDRLSKIPVAVNPHNSTAATAGPEATTDGPLGCATIALAPMSHLTSTLCLAYELYLAFQRYGKAGIVTYDKLLKELGPDALLKANDYLLTTWISKLEETYDLVIYIAEANSSRWSMKCVRQADTIFVIGNTLTDSWDVSPMEIMINKEAPAAKKELILLHQFSELGNSNIPKVYPQDSKAWIERRPWLSFHHHIGLRRRAEEFLHASLETIQNEYLTDAEKQNIDIYSDFSRLSRWISGNSVGVVLGGGGAKGAAHIGILRVLRENNIPIDMISGVSIGSFVGGLYAMHQDIDLVEKIAHSWFHKLGNLAKVFLLDFTLPIVAFCRGDAFNFCVREADGDVQIEDLWLPYFCLSTNITANTTRTHRSGMLWRYSRASMTLVSILPPMCDPIDGHYLMDGGYTNLVPANVMRQIGAKFILAVDVSAESEKITTNYGDSLSGFKILFHKILPFLKPLQIPTYFDIVEQLAFVQSALYLEIVKKMDRQSVYIRPPLDYFSSKDFLMYRDVLLVGYDFATKLLEKVEEGDGLEDIWEKMGNALPTVEARAQMHEQKEHVERLQKQLSDHSEPARRYTKEKFESHMEEYMAKPEPEEPNLSTPIKKPEPEPYFTRPEPPKEAGFVKGEEQDSKEPEPGFTEEQDVEFHEPEPQEPDFALQPPLEPEAPLSEQPEETGQEDQEPDSEDEPHEESDDKKRPSQ